MDLARPVESRTKEPFSMDDQSSATSIVAYQAGLEAKSTPDSGARSIPEDSPDTIALRESRLSEQDYVTYGSKSRPRRQIDPVERSVASLTPTPSNNNRERSKSPRPIVSAEARARWAMLASLAGVSRVDDVSETEEDGQSVDVSYVRQSKEDQTEKQDAGTGSRYSDPLSDPHLRPLHLLDHMGGSASIERYLRNLEKDPHVDSRLLQEGLQASKRLSGGYTEGLQDTYRSRGYTSTTKPQAISQVLHKEGPGQGTDQRRPGEITVDQSLKDSHTGARAELSDETRFSAHGQTPGGKSEARGHDHGQGLKNAQRYTEDEVYTDTREAGSLLQKVGDQGIAEGPQGSVQGNGDAARGTGDDLHGPNIRQDIRRGGQMLQEGMQRLDGTSLISNLRKDEIDLDTGFRDVKKLAEAEWSGLRVRRDIRRGEHALKDGLNKLEEANLRRGTQEGEHDLVTGIRRMEKAVHNLLPANNIPHDIQKGEHGQEVSFGVGEKATGGILNTPKLRRDLQGGEHDLDADTDVLMTNAANMLSGLNVQPAILEGEQNLKENLLKDAGKVKKALPGLDLHRYGSYLDQDLANSIHAGVGIAEREARKVESHCSEWGLEKHGQSKEHGLEALGTPSAGEYSKNERALGRDARAMGKCTENVEKDAGRSASNGVLMGEHAADHVVKAAAHLRSVDKRGVQEGDKAGNQGFPSRTDVLPPGTGIEKPTANVPPTYTGQPSMPHPLGVLSQRTNPNGHRVDQVGDHRSDHRTTPGNLQDSSFPILAQHTQPISTSEPAELRPFSMPAGSIANEPKERIMPAVSNNSQELSQNVKIPGKGGIAENGQGAGPKKPGPGLNSAAHIPIQRAQTSAQDRATQGAQRPSPKEISAGLNQVAAQATGLSSSQPNQQKRAGGQKADRDFGPSLAKPHSDTNQSSLIDLSPQLKQLGRMNRVLAKEEVSEGRPLPNVRPANLGPQRREEIPGFGKSNEQLDQRTTQRQSTKLGHNVQQIIPYNSIFFNQAGSAPQPGPVKSKHQELTTAGRQPSGGQEEVQTREQNKLETQESSRNNGTSQKPNLLAIPPHAQTKRDGPICQHEGHDTNPFPQRDQVCSAVKREQIAVDTSHAVSGPQQMLNVFKARSQASIDAAGGCPGFVDRESSEFPSDYPGA